MSILILELIGLLCIHSLIMLLILTVLELNIFREKSKHLLINLQLYANIFKIKTYDSIICGYFCIGFIDFILKGKSLTGFANLF